MAEKLAAAKPGDVGVMTVLADSYLFLGDVIGNSNYQSQGDAQGAAALYRKSVAIRQKLVADDPGNTEKQIMLSGSQTRLAQVLQSLADKPGALEAYRHAMEICEKLSRKNPVN